MGIDESVARFFDGAQTPGLTDVFWVITTLGGVAVMTTITVALVIALLATGRRHSATLVAVGMLVSVTITVVAKELIARVRPAADFRPPGIPAETSHSFPSGHTLNSATFVVLVLALLWPLMQHSWQRVGAIGVAGLAVGAEATSRMYLGYHWLTDVLAGLTIGCAWALCLVAWSRTWRLTDRPRGSARSGTADLGGRPRTATSKSA